MWVGWGKGALEGSYFTVPGNGSSLLPVALPAPMRRSTAAGRLPRSPKPSEQPQLRLPGAWALGCFPPCSLLFPSLLARAADRCLQGG